MRGAVGDSQTTEPCCAGVGALMTGTQLLPDSAELKALTGLLWGRTIVSRFEPNT